MNPLLAGNGDYATSIPRESGDEPRDQSAGCVAIPYSPRERG